MRAVGMGVSTEAKAEDIIETLRAENEALKAENEALKAENEALKAENEALKAEVAKAKKVKE